LERGLHSDSGAALDRSGHDRKARCKHAISALPRQPTRRPRRGTSPVACAAGRVHARAFPFALHGVHRSKEAPRLGLVLPCWSAPAIKLICYWIIGTMVESIIRWRCCYVGSNSLISLW